MKEKLYFYYTNDLHSNFDQWPRVTSFLNDKRAYHDARGDSYWFVDIGDHVDRSHPIAEAFLGKGNVRMLNESGYDFVTIGNNEGITLAHDDFAHLYDEASFEVLCANIESTVGELPAWVQPSGSIRTANGTRISLIGLTAPFNAFYELLGWHISNEFDVLDKYLAEIKAESDIVILLSHLGISVDQEIARRYKDIDVIIGGHTHHLLRNGEVVNNTIITAAGKHCSFIGEVILTWDTEEKKLIGKEAYATDITHLAKDLPAEQLLLDMQRKANEILDEQVVQLQDPLEVSWFGETAIMQELTNTLKDWTGADVALLNSGMLLDSFPAGIVTRKDIHRICPHPVNPVVVELKGDELLEVIRASFTKEFMELKLKGFGFRGKLLGRMVFSGLEVKTAFHKNGGEYVKEVILPGGKPLDHDCTYSVATADTFTFGRLLPEIARSERKDYFVPEFLRDLLAVTLKSKFEKA